MTVKVIFTLLVLLTCCGMGRADDRWINFAEDADLKYYLDQKSVTNLPDNVHILWIKSVAKDKDYYKREYNLNNLAYIFTNYEIDCAVSSYRVRGTIMFDRNRKEINKIVPTPGEPVLEPIPPESMLELAQNEICISPMHGKEKAQEKEEEHASAAPVDEPAIPSEPPTIQ